MSRDPLKEQGGLNLTGYEGGDPVNFPDYLGLSLLDWYNDMVIKLGYKIHGEEGGAKVEALITANSHNVQGQFDGAYNTFSLPSKLIDAAGDSIHEYQKNLPARRKAIENHAAYLEMRGDAWGARQVRAGGIFADDFNNISHSAFMWTMNESQNVNIPKALIDPYASAAKESATYYSMMLSGTASGEALNAQAYSAGNQLGGVTAATAVELPLFALSAGNSSVVTAGLRTSMKTAVTKTIPAGLKSAGTGIKNVATPSNWSFAGAGSFGYMRYMGPQVRRGLDNLIDLAPPARRRHILDGEVRTNGTFGGGHRAGTGFPGKSEFPSTWSDDVVMHYISDVATDPLSSSRLGHGSDIFVQGMRDGIEIEVLIRNGQIWTGYPTNVARNP